MALPKKQLKERLQEAGVPETAIDGIVTWILDGHTASVDAVKEQLDAANNSINDLTAKNAELAQITKERDSYKKEVETLKASSDKATAVQKEFDDFKAEVSRRETNSAKRKAITSTLKNAGVNRDELVELLLGKVDLDTVEMDGEKLKDVDAFVNPLKEQYSSLFATVTNQGTPTTTPPTGGGDVITKEQFGKMGYIARNQLYKENPELYKELTGKKE